jgi:hypothetical protein
MKNSDPVLQPKIDATEILTDQMLLVKEQAVITQTIDNTSVISNTTLSGTSQWSHASSSPIDAVQAQMSTIIKAIGRKPNTLVLPWDTFNAVRRHADITGIMANTQNQVIVSPDLRINAISQQLADIFDVGQVLVPSSTYNTTIQGQTASMDFLWGKTAMLLYVPPNPSPRMIAGGLTFSWDRGGTTQDGFEVREWDQKVVGAGAFYVWLDAVA